MPKSSFPAINSNLWRENWKSADVIAVAAAGAVGSGGADIHAQPGVPLTDRPDSALNLAIPENHLVGLYLDEHNKFTLLPCLFHDQTP
jgi:hypothetical protein